MSAYPIDCDSFVRPIKGRRRHVFRNSAADSYPRGVVATGAILRGPRAGGLLFQRYDFALLHPLDEIVVGIAADSVRPFRDRQSDSLLAAPNAVPLEVRSFVTGEDRNLDQTPLR
jgi:hypothetical protein